MTLLLLIGLPDDPSACAPPNITAPSYQSLGGSRGSQGRPHVKIKDGLTRRLRSSLVVVNNVADFLACAADVPSDIPVVSVERRLRAINMLTLTTQPLVELDSSKTYPNLAGYNHPMT